MRVAPGDRVVVESDKVGQPSRHGVVADAQGDLLTVQWDTGKTTTFVPASGSLRVER